MCSYYLYSLDLKSVKLKTDAPGLLLNVLKRKKSRYNSIGGPNSAALALSSWVVTLTWCNAVFQKL